MNVAKGDLAIIIGASKNAGSIVEVGDFYGNLPPQYEGLSHIANWWYVKGANLKGLTLKQQGNITYLTPTTKLIQRGICPDHSLRKITGPDVKIEDTESLDKPIKVTL